jgi:hypothetical protein
MGASGREAPLAYPLAAAVGLAGKEERIVEDIYISLALGGCVDDLSSR